MTDMETAAVEQDTGATPSEAIETTVDTEAEAMGEVWDRLQGAEDEAPTDEGVEDAGRDDKGRFKAKDAAEPVEEGERQESKPDTRDKPAIFANLPRPIQDKWSDLPEDVRDSIVSSHHQMASKAMEAGRLMKGLGPIRDAMIESTKVFPELGNMTPDQVAKEVTELAHTKANLIRDPVNTLLQVAQITGATEALRAIFTGQQPAPQAQQQRQPMQEQMNPDIIRGIVERTMQEGQTANTLTQWAADKPHYQTVESDLPFFIQVAQRSAQPGTPHGDILDQAYNMAVGAYGLRAPQTEAATAPDESAPQRSQAALKARSVNVKSQGSKPTPLTEEQAMAAAYERAMRS